MSKNFSRSFSCSRSHKIYIRSNKIKLGSSYAYHALWPLSYDLEKIQDRDKSANRCNGGITHWRYCSLALNHRNTLRWRHNGHDSVSNHQPHDCLLNRLFRRRSKKTSKLRATGLCAGNSRGTGEFPAQMASNAENVSIDDVIMIQDAHYPMEEQWILMQIKTSLFYHTFDTKQIREEWWH